MARAPAVLEAAIGTGAAAVTEATSVESAPAVMELASVVSGRSQAVQAIGGKGSKGQDFVTILELPEKASEEATPLTPRMSSRLARLVPKQANGDVIGVDLGTTSCCVAVMERSTAEADVATPRVSEAFYIGGGSEEYYIGDDIDCEEAQRDVGADVVVVQSSASSVAAWAGETAKQALKTAAELEQKVQLAMEKAEASDRRLEEYQRELQLLFEAKTRHAVLMAAKS